MKKQIMVRLGVFCAMIGCLAGGLFWPAEAQQKHVRKAYVAGQFYPGTPQTLTQQVQQYLDQAGQPELPGKLRALVAPHAGYRFSAPIAAYAYKQIVKPFRRVFILASNHSPYADVDGLSVPEYTHYATPLGEVPVSPLARKLLQDGRISYVPEAHSTHVVEVQLPFLQLLLDEFKIIPIVTGRMNLDDVKRFGALLAQYADEQTLFIVSTDLSHYHAYDEAVQLDTACVHALEHLDSRGVIESELCGQGAALIVLEIAKQHGWQGKALDYRNSGDTAGDKSRVVGYAALAYYAPAHDAASEADRRPTQPEAESASVAPRPEPNPLSAAEQQVLLELAQTTLEQYVKHQTVYDPPTEEFAQFPRLREQRGVFVTLKKDGQLRGCIGNLIGRQPLYRSVRDNTISAAARDARFQPVTAEELEAISLSISVLDVPQLVQAAAPDEYLERLRPQADGVILVNGRRSATYLPQVWQQLPDPVEFLGRLCAKGGLAPDCWRQPGTQLYTYQAQAFGADH